jgi:hypothetical protein
MSADFQCPRCGRTVRADEAVALSWHWYLGALVLGLGAPVREDTCQTCARKLRSAGLLVLSIIAVAGVLIWAL